ncbi:extracellular solute-binding protein [Cohnella sp. 56]|uniref:extracellular solute-binding protein n=1 Tax=Cohnella sp. 56 TaxID=3113722 RepID=UPI0030E7786A
MSIWSGSPPRLYRTLAAAAILLLAWPVAGCRDAAEPSASPGGGQTAAASASAGAPGTRTPAEEEDWEPYEADDEEQTLTVMYASEEAFYRDIGNLFIARYPKVSFEVVDLSATRGDGDLVADYERVLDKRQPDVLLMEPPIYRALADKGRLQELELPIRRSGFDLDGFVPGVIELLKEGGGGHLYGLSNHFTSRALYYNKTLFDRYGIPYPASGISWEEALRLAGRFPKRDGDGQPLYGLYQPTFTVSPFDLVQRIGAAGKLAALDPKRTSLQYGSQSWSRVFKQVMEGYRSGAVAYPKAPLSDNGDGSFSMSLGGNAFAEGKAAMAVDDVLTLRMMDIQARGGEEAAFDWGIVPAPVDPASPGRTTLFELSDIYAINRDTDQAALAWTFLSFLHSDEYMKLISRSTTGLLAREGYERDARGRDLSAFYALGPDTGISDTLVPVGFSQAFQHIAADAIEAAVSGKLTDDEALAQIVAEGQRALDEKRKSAGLESFDLNVFGSARAATGG